MLKDQRQGRKVIVSSIVHSDGEDIVVNYHSLINRGYKYFENSTIMLLNLLKRIEVNSIAIAGFDGFDTEKKNNYIDGSYQNDRHIYEFVQLNEEIGDMLTGISETLEGKCEIHMITPSMFEKNIVRNN